jgi:hypothetical protein
MVERRIAPLHEDSARQIWVGWGAALVCLGAAYLFGGNFWPYFFIFVGVVVALRGHQPGLFSKHVEAQIIAGIPYQRKESIWPWVLAATIVLLLAGAASVVHRRLAPEKPDIAKLVVEAVKRAFEQEKSSPKVSADISIPSVRPSQPQLGPPSRTSQPSKSAQPCVSDTAPYVPPRKGNLVRFEDTFLVPSRVLCPPNGMTDEARIACLCPNRLPYKLRAMPAPEDGNFETEITISKVCNPMYKVRLFFRDMYYKGGSVLSAAPHNGGAPGVSLLRGLFEDDKYSISLSSTAPEDSFQTSLVTTGGLRIVCINQEN